ATFADKLHPLGPTWDHTLEWKWDRFATAIRTIENGLIIQPALVVGNYRIARRGFLFASFAQDAIFESRCGFGKFARRIGVDFSWSNNLLGVFRASRQLSLALADRLLGPGHRASHRLYRALGACHIGSYHSNTKS